MPRMSRGSASDGAEERPWEVPEGGDGQRHQDQDGQQQQQQENMDQADWHWDRTGRDTAESDNNQNNVIVDEEILRGGDVNVSLIMSEASEEGEESEDENDY